MTEQPRKPRRWRRVGKVAGAVVGAFVAIVVVLGIGLAVWDGGANLNPQRQLLPAVTIDLRTAQTKHGPIEYDLYGTEGPVVLSVHAGLGGADQGRLFASWLQDDGFRILSPSRPGYLGTPLDSGRTLDEQADLLAALLDELRIERVGVLAVSAGGPAAYTFAARYPQRVWALASIGSVSLAEPDAAPGTGLRRTFINTIGQKLARLTASLSFESVISSTLDETSLFTPEQRAQRVDYITHTPQVKQLFTAMFETTFPYERRMPGTDNDLLQTREMALPFDRITAPTLVVHGTRDGDVVLEHGENAARRIPKAQHHWMPDEDHLGFWLSPVAQQAQEVVRTFLHTHAPKP